MNVYADELAPKAREKGLVVRELDDEVLIYDLERHEAHCLNPTAAFVWNHCDGQMSISELARLLQQKLNAPVTVDERAIWYALTQLGKDHLLEEQISRPVGAPVITRRHMVRKVGAVAAAAAITSIAVPTAALAANSCMGCNVNPCADSTHCATCPGNCTTCGPLSKCCVPTTGSNRPPGGCPANGMTGQCCSGTCSPSNGKCT